MSKVIVERSDMVAIADSVRSKAGTTAQMNVGELKTAIDNIETGAKLPTLSNEGAAADLLSGKQLIDSDGEIVTGTFSLDSEATIQDDLIAQIKTALVGKAGGNSSSSGFRVAIGDIIISEGIKSANTELANVSGLDFKPVYIVIVATIGTANITSTSAYIIGASSVSSTGELPKQAIAYQRSSSNVRGYTGGLYDEITITDDGFVWKSEKSVYVSPKYKYIAIG